IPAIRDAGVVGRSGASYPTHAKISSSLGKADVVLVNGAECETFLTSDDRLMRETPVRIVDGLRAVMRAMDIDHGVIAIEDNKPAAIDAVRQAAQGRSGVSVVTMAAKYPQGGKKQLIKAVLGREVPIGGRPVDARVVILNVGSVAAIADAVIEGRPLVSRITTVTGAVARPANFRIPIGSILAEVIAGCAGYTGEPGRIIFGGSMNGVSVPDDKVSVTTATNGILVLTKEQLRDETQEQCIRCGFCVHACPSFLRPYRLMELVNAGELDAAEKEHVNECIVCNACSYVCPAKRWIAATIRIGKDQLLRRKSQ
ncbi:MAG: RnfABCDGE type electron transport complex subunit C, partial [Clostridia bacterium]|nr:RnfABCDGE type electron transport complex subunit C [Clostridia bacterium]